MKAFDVNEAGQIFAYLCYLRSLPYQEQQHWASFNEEPKAGISAWAIQNDFKGEFTDHVDALQRVLGIVGGWHTVVEELRERLTSRGISFDKQAGSISLLEQWLRAIETDSTGLLAMRTVQKVHTKVKGHAGHEVYIRGYDGDDRIDAPDLHRSSPCSSAYPVKSRTRNTASA